MINRQYSIFLSFSLVCATASLQAWDFFDFNKKRIAVIEQLITQQQTFLAHLLLTTPTTIIVVPTATNGLLKKYMRRYEGFVQFVADSKEADSSKTLQAPYASLNKLYQKLNSCVTDPKNCSGINGAQLQEFFDTKDAKALENRIGTIVNLIKQKNELTPGERACPFKQIKQWIAPKK